jgi:hypothetical protein
MFWRRNRRMRALGSEQPPFQQDVILAFAERARIAWLSLRGSDTHPR